MKLTLESLAPIARLHVIGMVDRPDELARPGRPFMLLPIRAIPGKAPSLGEAPYFPFAARCTRVCRFRV